MTRLVSSNSGEQISSQKKQNIEGSNEIQSDNGSHSASVESTEIVQVSITQTSRGNGIGSHLHSTSDESTEVSDTEPGNTIPIPNPTLGVAASPPTMIESTKITQVSDTEPGNTISIPTSGVAAAAPPTMIETNVDQPPITGNGTGSRRNSTSDESAEITQVCDTEPGNTISIPTSGVAAAAPPTMIETNVEQPPITGNGTGSRRHSTSDESAEITQVFDTEPGNTIPIPTTEVAAAPPIMIETNVQPPITGQPKGQGNRLGNRSERLSMYRAAFEGDWLAAEIVLGRDPSLAFDVITERGDRALHVAAAIKHKEFVQKLVEWMSENELELQDGSGYTACCYAAMSGIVETARIMIEKKKNLITANITDGTPLHKAALSGNAKMVSYFLEKVEVEDLSTEKWFDLFQVTISNKMYDVALEILEKNPSLAPIKRDTEGTALHMLARLDISDFSTIKKPTLLEIYLGRDAALSGFPRKMRSDIRLLAKKLWDELQNQEHPAVILELLREPPILHDAAKVGNVELITMLTDTYPDLIWERNRKEHTIFHIAVMYRQDNVFRLIHRMGALKDFVTIIYDNDGNNILHLAGKLEPPDSRKIVLQSAFLMHRELAWFKEVEAIVPPSCLKKRNDNKQTPRELFSMEHKELLGESKMWMRNTADSCMLIATIMLTVVFAAAFTVPGGNNGSTGIPVLLKSNWFICFVMFEALALFGSILCIIMFWSIMTSSFEEDQFLHILPYQLKLGFSGLFFSLVGTLSAFMSAYFLAFVGERPWAAWLVRCVILLVYVVLVLAMFSEFSKLWLHTSLLGQISRILPRPSSHRLFSRSHTTRKK